MTIAAPSPTRAASAVRAACALRATRAAEGRTPARGRRPDRRAHDSALKHQTLNIGPYDMHLKIGARGPPV